VVIAAADWAELGHASVSLAHSVVAVANTDHVSAFGRSMGAAPDMGMDAVPVQ